MDSQQYDHLISLLGRLLDNQLLANEKTAQETAAQLKEALNQNEYLRRQLSMTEALLTAKDETLTLLRASRNNSN